MATKQATWDNGVELDGLVATFDRDTTGFDFDLVGLAATAVIADEPRYGGDCVVFGAPTVETVAALTGGYRVYSAGFDAGSVPVVVVNYMGTPTLTFYRDGSAVSVLNAKTLLGGANKPTTTIGDLLHGEADEEADYCHEPRGGAQVPGLALIPCCTFKYNGSGSRTSSANYTIDGVSCCFSDDNGATFQLGWRSGTLTSSPLPSDFGAEWDITITHLERDGTTDAYAVTMTSYSSGLLTDLPDPYLRTAHSLVFKVEGGPGAWTVSGAKIIEHTIGTAQKTHAHYGLTVKDPEVSGGTRTYVEVGDDSADNRTEEYRCADWANFLAGATLMTGAAGVYEGGTHWSARTVTNGNDGGTAATQWQASQTISCAPGPDGGWYAGVDEGIGGPILRATVPAATGDRVNWLPAYALGGTHQGDGTTNYAPNWRCFSLNAWEYQAANPAVCALVAPGSGWPSGFHDAARIIFKPKNGDRFGVVAAIQDEANYGAQLRPVLSPSGYIWFGSGDQNGLRRVPAPTPNRTRQQKAIGTSPGGTNLALATLVEQADANNNMTVGATPPITFPTSGSVVLFDVPASNPTGIGTLKITADSVSRLHSTMLVSFLVCTPTDAAAIDADTYFRVRFASIEGGSTGDRATLYIGPKRIEPRGAITRLVYELRNGAGGRTSGFDWDLTTAGTGDADLLRITAQFQSGGGETHGQKFYLACDTVLVDHAAMPGYIIPPATTGDAESLEVSGFTCGAVWTGGVVGVLGGDGGRDCRSTTANTFREVCTLWESATKYLELACDADDQVRIKATNGGNTATATITGLPKFLVGDPLLFAIDYDGSNYHYALSIAGCEARTGTLAPAGAVVAPTKMLLGHDDDGTVREATRWLHTAVRESIADGAGRLLEFVTSGAMTPRPGARSRSRMRGRGRSVVR